MPRRHAAALALTLTLAVGCGGGAAPRDAGDAAPDRRDATADVSPDQAPDQTSDQASYLGGDALPDLLTDVAADADAVSDTRADGDAPADVSSDRAEIGFPNLCGTSRGTLQLGAAPVSTVLGPVGANPAVSCSGGQPTAGPDAAYALDLSETTAVEVVVDSAFPVAIAVRTGCADGVSELACNGASSIVDPATADGGAGDAAPPGDGSPNNGPPDIGPDDPSTRWRTTLRTRLAAGKYTVIVDTVGTSERPSPVSISARAVAPQSNASCATPLLLSAGGTAQAQELSLGGDASSTCGGRTGTTLYYTIGVPPGQRLTARATVTGGDRAWMPLLDASAACGAGGTCLAQGHAASGTLQVLDWLNNGPTWRLVFLSVSSDGPVNGARFDLSVSLADQLATCARPTPVKDGTLLLGQDAQRAPLSETNSCDGARARSLYYSATLLPRQQLGATAASSSGITVALLSVRASCESTTCVDGSSTVSFMNDTAETVTVLIEARPTFSTTNGTFDLLISMPPPPAGVSVVAPFGLTTTETGGTAKATVALRSPPSAPVTIALASDTPTEGTVTPASLQFDKTNWDVPREVTITGVDDQTADGARRYIIVTSAAMSTDARYAGLEVDDFEVTNQDDDPGLTFEGIEHLATSEGGTTATFKVRLNRQPTAPVRVPLSSSDVSEAAVSTAELVFSETTWNVAQQVTVTGVDDAIRDGAQPYTIVVGALVSADAAYGGQNPPDVAGLNRDDDQTMVGTKILSGDRACTVPYGRSIATDLAGNIYVVMTCDGDLVVTTSADAGATFTEPTVVVPGGSFQVALEGGASGVAYLAYIAPDGLVLKRTTNGGLTWSAGQALLNQSGNLSLAAAKDTLLVSAATSDSGNSTFLWRSLNGGRSQATRTWIDRVGVEVFVRPDGRTVFLVEPGPDTTRVRRSTNAGETFELVGTLITPPGGGHWGMTSTSLVYTYSDSITSYPLAALDDSDGFGSYINNVLALTIDERDIVTTIDIDLQTNRLRQSRFDFRAATPAVQAKLIGPYADGAAAVALSPRAVATMFWSGTIVLFSVTSWP